MKFLSLFVEIIPDQHRPPLKKRHAGKSCFSKECLANLEICQPTGRKRLKFDRERCTQPQISKLFVNSKVINVKRIRNRQLKTNQGIAGDLNPNRGLKVPNVANADVESLSQCVPDSTQTYKMCLNRSKVVSRGGHFRQKFGPSIF